MGKQEQLIEAVKNGQIDLCKKIIAEDEAMLAVCDRQKENVLMIAIRHQQLAVVKYLVEMLMPISQPLVHNALYAMQLVVRLGHEQIFEYFMTQELSLSQIGQYGYTLLHEAAQNNRPNMLRRLLESSLRKSVDHCGNGERTALHLAVKEGHFECAQLLLAAGANANLHDAAIGSALHIAVARGKYHLIGILIHAGADVNSKNKMGEPVLHMALGGLQPHEGVVALLKRGVSVNQCNSQGLSALSFAQKNKLSEKLKEWQLLAKRWQDTAINAAEDKFKNDRIEQIDLAGDWFAQKDCKQLLELLDRNQFIVEVLLGPNLRRGDSTWREQLDLKLYVNRILHRAKTLLKERKLQVLLNLLTDPRFKKTTNYSVYHVMAIFGDDSLLRQSEQQVVLIEKDASGLYPSQLAAQRRHTILAEQLHYIETRQNVQKLLMRQGPNTTQHVHYEVERYHLHKLLDAVSLPDEFYQSCKEVRSQIEKLPLDVAVEKAGPILWLIKQSQRAGALLQRCGRDKKKSENLRQVGTIALQAHCEAIDKQISYCQQSQGLGVLIPSLVSLMKYYKGALLWLEESKDIGQTLSMPALLHGSFGQRILHERTRAILCSPQRGSSSFGTHTVIAHGGIHFKLGPHAPGIEFAVDSLNKVIARQGSAPTELVKITLPDEGSLVYLAAKSVVGTELKYILQIFPEHLSRLDPFNFTSLIIQSLLTSPQDGKPDNYMACLEVDGQHQVKRMELVGIDNDIAFATAFVRYPQGSYRGKHFINVRNVLYFFPQMAQPLDATFKKYLLTRSIEGIIVEWIKQLILKNNSYAQLLKDGVFNEQEFGVGRPGEGLKLPIQFVPGTLIRIYSILTKIVQTMQQNPEITHFQLFQVVEPLLSCCYQHIQKKRGDILSCNEALYDANEPPVEEWLASYMPAEEIEQGLNSYHDTVFDFEEKRTASLETEFIGWLAQIEFRGWSLARQKQLLYDCKELDFVQKLSVSGLALNSDTLIAWLECFSKLTCLVLNDTLIESQHLSLIAVLRPTLAVSINENCLSRDNRVNQLKMLYQAHCYLSVRIGDHHYDLHCSEVQTIERLLVNEHHVTWLLEYLLQRMPSTFNEELGGGNTLVHRAAEHRQSEMLGELIRYGFDVNHQNHGGYTALHVAAKLGDEAVVTLLTDHGADPTLQKKHNSETPRMVASRAGHVRIVAKLALYESEFKRRQEQNLTSQVTAQVTTAKAKVEAPQASFDLVAPCYIQRVQDTHQQPISTSSNNRHKEQPGSLSISSVLS